MCQIKSDSMGVARILSPGLLSLPGLSLFSSASAWGLETHLEKWSGVKRAEGRCCTEPQQVAGETGGQLELPSGAEVRVGAEGGNESRKTRILNSQSSSLSKYE